MSCQSIQKGVGLVEVLVALLVLSLGLMGMAGLQLASLQTTREALIHSQATLLAYDMVDRMRANKSHAESTTDYQKEFSTKITDFNNCVSSSCSPVQLARYDMGSWASLLANQLPGGVGQVEKDSDSPPFFTVSVRYLDHSDNPVTVVVETIL